MRRGIRKQSGNPFHTNAAFIQTPVTWLDEVNIELKGVNPSRPDPGRREKINLNFYFHTSFWCLIRFYEDRRGLYKTF